MSPTLWSASRARRWGKKRKQGLCVECPNPADSKFLRCSACREKNKNTILKHRAKLKQEVFDAYGGAICACKNCPERQRPKLDFLTLNHIGGGGTKHRQSLGGVRVVGGGVTGAGHVMYRWLRNNGFPPGFNVLCWNCQWGVHLNKGICPHEEQA